MREEEINKVISLVNCPVSGGAHQHCVITHKWFHNHRNRYHFTVIPRTRGIGVCSVTAGRNVAFAVTENHDVYMWGEKSLCPTGRKDVETVTTTEGLSEVMNEAHIKLLLLLLPPP